MGPAPGDRRPADAPGEDAHCCVRSGGVLVDACLDLLSVAGGDLTLRPSRFEPSPPTWPANSNATSPSAADRRGGQVPPGDSGRSVDVGESLRARRPCRATSGRSGRGLPEGPTTPWPTRRPLLPVGFRWSAEPVGSILHRSSTDPRVPWLTLSSSPPTAPSAADYRGAHRNAHRPCQPDCHQQ